MLFSMAYEVTASRRRPQRFEELVGQDFVAATLKNAVQSGKIAHAYLFSGPRGCGKTSAARILAKVLNCSQSPDQAPCGACSACTEIAKGSCLDVIEIDGASNTGVNDVRQIKDEVLFPPNSCKYKIYIIDEVHMLSVSAFNALLKTIEEPPPYVIFIFATTELHKVPATIKSRCQQFHFRLGSPEQIKTLLADAAKETGIKADEDALFWIAREATGSFRDAYTLFDQVAAFSEGHITYEKIRDKLGLVGTDQLNTLCTLCALSNEKEALLFIDDMLQSGVSVEQCVSNISDYLRALLFIKAGVTKEALLSQAPERYSAEALNAWSASQLENALSRFLQLYRDIRYSLNPRYELELAVQKLCSLSSLISAADVKQAVDKAAHLLTGKAYQTAAQSGAENAAPASSPVQVHYPAASSMPQDAAAQAYTASENQTMPAASAYTQNAENPHLMQNTGSPLSVAQLKEQTVAEISLSKAAAAAALSRTGAWILENDTLRIPVQTAFEQNQLAGEISLLNSSVAKLWGSPLHCKIELIAVQNKNEPEDIPEQVQMVCDVFQGQIQKIEIQEKDESGEPD